MATRGNSIGQKVKRDLVSFKHWVFFIGTFLLCHGNIKENVWLGMVGLVLAGKSYDNKTYLSTTAPYSSSLSD